MKEEIQMSKKEPADQKRDAVIIKKIYEAVDVPYDSEAYETLKAKVKKKRFWRVALRTGLCILLLLAVAGSIGIGVMVYNQNIDIVPPTGEESVSVQGPTSVEAKVEGSHIVIRFRPGTYALDYARIYACRKDKGDERVEVLYDEETGTIFLPYLKESMVYTIYLFDEKGNSFIREASVTLKPVQ